MPYYSAFWHTYYENIGSCMTEPLDNNITYEGDTTLKYKQKYLQMIDIAWMNGLQLKWIGWDNDERIAWITPGGMVYNFKDLKRTSTGEEWEKHHGKMQLLHDGKLPAYLSLGDGLYEDELEIQKHCGLCPGNVSIPIFDMGFEFERPYAPGT